MMLDPEDVLDDLRCSLEDCYEPDEEEQPLPEVVLGETLRTLGYPEFGLELIGGVEGDCIALNSRRIAGPKPWGGGAVKERWRVRVGDLVRAIPGLRYDPPSEPTNERREG